SSIRTTDPETLPQNTSAHKTWPSRRPFISVYQFIFLESTVLLAALLCLLSHQGRRNGTPGGQRPVEVRRQGRRAREEVSVQLRGLFAQPLLSMYVPVYEYWRQARFRTGAQAIFLRMGRIARPF